MSWWNRQYYKALEGPVYYGTITTKTANETITNNAHVIFVDVDAGNVTITLPASPFDGQEHIFKCIDDNTAGNTLTIGRNGNTIEGAASDHAMTKDNSARMVYTSTEGWRII
jgi:hypothetical protein